MNYFNQTAENSLKELFNNTDPFKMIILWGERGNGKTFIAHSVLKELSIKVKDITFFEENILPLNLFEDQSSIIYDEATALMQCSHFFQENYCLFFQNMEFCDLDSERILFRLLKYYKSNEQNACIILEYNVLKEPDDLLCSLSGDKLFIECPDIDCFYQYYAVHFDPTQKTKELYKEVLNITHRNIHNFFSVINALQFMGALYIENNKFVYNKNSTYKMPNNLFDLYIDLFDSLKEYAREPLISTAPFSKQIYTTIIRGIYQNYNTFEEYLKLLSEKGCFIQNANQNKDSRLFHAQFIFPDENARNAIIACIDSQKAEGIVSRYYNYLDSLYSNKHIYNSLQDTDKMLLLSTLTKKRQNMIKINQIHYIVVNGRFCPKAVRRFCPIVAGFNAGTYKVPACVL